MQELLYYLYLLSYIIFLVSSIFSYFSIKDLPNLVLNLGSLLGIVLNIFIFICKKKNTNIFNIFVFFIVILLFIMGSIFHFKVVSLQLVVLLSLLLNINLIKLNAFIDTDIFIKIFMLSIAIFLSFFNITLPSINGIGDSFGFIYSNDAGAIILSIISSLILFCYVKINRLKKSYFNYILIMCILLIIMFYYLTESRALLVCGIFIILLVIVSKFISVRTIMLNVTIPIFILLVLLSITVPYRFNSLNQFWYYINNISSNRIALQSLILQVRPLKMSGQVIPNYIFRYFENFLDMFHSSVGDVRIDNFYLSVAYFYGLIGLIIVIIIFLRAAFICVKNKNYIICILLLSLMIYSCIESDTISAFNLTPLIYAFALQYKSRLGIIKT